MSSVFALPQPDIISRTGNGGIYLHGGEQAGSVSSHSTGSSSHICPTYLTLIDSSGSNTCCSETDVKYVIQPVNKAVESVYTKFPTSSQHQQNANTLPDSDLMYIDGEAVRIFKLPREPTHHEGYLQPVSVAKLHTDHADLPNRLKPIRNPNLESISHSRQVSDIETDIPRHRNHQERMSSDSQVIPSYADSGSGTRKTKSESDMKVSNEVMNLPNTDKVVLYQESESFDI